MAYIPPHRRGTTQTHVGPSQDATCSIPLQTDPFVRHFIEASSVYKEWLAMKTKYGANPAVDQKFQYRRAVQRRSLGNPTDSSSVVFRDQFKNAMNDVNSQIDSALSRGIHDFVDLGCAPGGFSKWILEHHEETRGIGVTLPWQEHGLPMWMQDWTDSERCRYRLLEANLVRPSETLYALANDTFAGGHCTLVICGARYRDENTTRTRARDVNYDSSSRDRLELSQLLIACRVLKHGGTLISLASLKVSPRTVDTLVFLRENFDTLTPTKGKHLHNTRSSYYLVCQGFKGGETSRMCAIQRIEGALERLNDRTERMGRLSMEDGDEMDLSRRETGFVVDLLQPLWKNQTDALTCDLQGLQTATRGGHGCCKSSYVKT